MERNRGGRPRHPDVLTPAEWRVLEALREGGTNADIAGRLGLSLDTVKTHISNMLAKLELRDRRSLAAWRPEERRGRLRAVFGVPAALVTIARPVAWVGIGTAAAAGVTVAVVAAVVAVAVVLVVVPGDGEPSAVVRAPLASSEATSAPAPTSTVAPTATAPPTPAATAPPTPAATPTPTATPTPSAAAAPGACAQATLGVDPATEAGLAADCATLLASKDTLRGTAALDWSADTAMESWDGVSLEGTPSRVTGLNLEGRMLAGSIPAGLGSLAGLRTLDLAGNQLTGAIPPELGDLRALTHVYLSGNALTGCVPRALRAVASNDIATLDLESCALPSVTLSYDTYDTTGAVTTAGSYAFLTEGDDGTMSAVTTYEALRDGTTTALLIHTSDADETSRSDVYDDVGAGDIFEWTEADDCFVRYTVTEVKPDPAGTVPQKALSVAWMTFAYTGCSGAIRASDDVLMTWGAMPNLGGASLRVPVIHGVFAIAPEDWDGESLYESVRSNSFSTPATTSDIAVARKMDFWREPTIPENWTFRRAVAGLDQEGPGGVIHGYCATWMAQDRAIPLRDGTSYQHSQRGVVICAESTRWRYGEQEAYWGRGAHETRVIAGRPARLMFSPLGPEHLPGFPTRVEVFDPETDVTYTIMAEDFSLRSNPEAVVEMARSLFADGGAR